MKNATEVHFPNSKGERLWGRLFKPAATTSRCVIICHGFAGKSSSRNKISWARHLRKLGFAVLAFDFSGCGRSQGAFRKTSLGKQVGDLESAIAFLSKRGYSEFGLAGHSFGGIVSLVEAGGGKWKRRIGAVAAIASPFLIHKYPDVLMEKEVVKNWKRTGAISFRDGGFGYSLDYSFKLDQKKYDFAKIIRGVKVPMLIVHGTADKIIPSYEAKMIFGKAKCGKKLLLVKGADHRFSGHGREICNALGEFFLEELK
ncbi:alpha/beta fold hydrolase [Candidatus Micrarchaeota archaeon]|nr:alpha/beta fold hydrolase [Candidatus Micrarchaeota archaeon]